MKSRETVLFLLILLLAGILRFVGITVDSFWLDEGYQTMTEATAQPLPDFFNPQQKPFLFKYEHPQPLNVVLENFKAVDPLCPPLYAVLLNRWMTLVGTGDLAVRSMSAFISTASVAGTYLIARGFFGWHVSVLAAWLQAVSPYDIHYAQEARMYSLAVLSAVISCGSLSWLLFADGKLRPLLAVTYSVSTWALINTHYTGLFTVAFQGLFSLWYCIRYRVWRRLLWLAGCWLATLAMWAPWFDIFRHAAGNRTESFYVARRPSLWWPFYALFVRIFVNWVCFLSGKHVVAFALPIYAAAAGLVASAIAFTRKNHNIKVVYLWTWALLPAVILWLIDVIENHRVVEITRYTITTTPAIYILCGAGIRWAIQQRGWFRVLLVAHGIFALVNIVGNHLQYQREPWKEVAAAVEASCSQDDLIIVSQYYNIACLDRYLSRPFTQVGLSPVLGEKSVEEAIGNRARFWVVSAQEGDRIIQLIPSRFKMQTHRDFTHSLHMWLYQR